MVAMGMPGLRGGRKPRLHNTFSEQGNSVTIGFLLTGAVDLSSGLKDTVRVRQKHRCGVAAYL